MDFLRACRPPVAKRGATCRVRRNKSACIIPQASTPPTQEFLLEYPIKTGMVRSFYILHKAFFVLQTINKVFPHILFVGFGAPKQEKWLYRHSSKINYGGAMVVGGTFDYISGKKKTPPSWIADSGLEWLWRILIGDQKIERVTSAFPKFPLIIFWQKLTGKAPNES